MTEQEDHDIPEDTGFSADDREAAKASLELVAMFYQMSTLQRYQLRQVARDIVRIELH